MINIKINKEIRSVKENAVAGFSLYEALFLLVGILLGVSIGCLLYFKLKVPLNIVAFVSVFIVAPFGFLGMWSYHEMTGVQFVKAWLSTYLTEPRVLTYGSKNKYYEEYKERLRTKKGGGKIGFFRNSKKSRNRQKTREEEQA